MKKFNFVYDKKSGDILAPRFVSNHVVAIRDYSQMSDSIDAVFVKFPEDFLLVTVPLECVFLSDSKVDSISLSIQGSYEVTPFVEIVGDKNA